MVSIEKGLSSIDYVKAVNLLKEDFDKELAILESRIKEAITYIKSFDYYIPEDDIPELLEILEGKYDYQ